MNDEEKFDRWLADAAKTYNAPPTRVPRDEMWDVVARELRRSDALVVVSGDGGPRDTHHSPLATRRWRAAWGALAASLVLAAGIGIGYGLRGKLAPTVQQPVAAAPVPDSAATRALDVAMLQHLSNAEALLVAYRGTDTDADGHVHDWARDVLATTRLLLDSRAATDPLRRQLLEDLELILVQIVQLPSGSSKSVPPDERELIDQSLNRDQLLTRLRTSIPAGPARGT